MLTIDQAIERLQWAREELGGDAEIRFPDGENLMMIEVEPRYERDCGDAGIHVIGGFVTISDRDDLDRTQEELEEEEYVKQKADFTIAVMKKEYSGSAG